jgi:hypothetical protein
VDAHTVLFADALTSGDVEDFGAFLLARIDAIEAAHHRDSEPGRAVQGLRLTVEGSVRGLLHCMDTDPATEPPHLRQSRLSYIQARWDLLARLADGWRYTDGYSPRWSPVPYLDQADADRLDAAAREFRRARAGAE